MPETIPWVPIVHPSEEFKLAIAAYNRRSRCYREQKLCPGSGCDCERSLTPVDEKEGKAGDEK
jgi:hypothetical protein